MTFSKLARAQGYSVVTIRPRQEKPDTSNTYFMRLRYPDRPTKLETLVAQYEATLRAIAPIELAGTGKFINSFLNTLDAVKNATRNSKLYAAIFGELQGIQASEPKVTDFLSKPVVRIAGLTILGLALATIIPQIIAGVTVAPVMIAAAVALLIIGAWVSFAPENFRQAVPCKMVVLSLSLVVAGLKLRDVWDAPMLSDFFMLMANGSVPAFSHLHGTTMMVNGLSHINLSRDSLHVYASGSIDTAKVGHDFGQMLMLAATPFAASMQSITGLKVTDTVKKFAQKTFLAKHKREPEQFRADDYANKMEKKMKDDLGEPGTLEGAVSIMSLVDQGLAAHFLTLMGQQNITSEITLNPRTKYYDIDNLPYIIGSPFLSSSQVYEPDENDPENQNGELTHIIYLIQPGFKKDGKILHLDKLPPQYIAGVIRGFLINELVDTDGKLIIHGLRRITDGGILEELKKTISEGRKKWMNALPVNMGDLLTEDALSQIIFAGYFHEDRHGKNLHTPEIIPNFEQLAAVAKTLAQQANADEQAATVEQAVVDGRIKAEDAQFLTTMVRFPKVVEEYRHIENSNKYSGYSIQSWIDRWNADPELTDSMVHYKNTIKAVVESLLIPETEVSDFSIINWRHLENQNDYGSMFDFETGHKIYLLKELLRLDEETQTLNDKVLVSIVYEIDNAREEGKLLSLLNTEFGWYLDKKGLRAETVAAEIEKKYKVAENSHPYITLFKDPPLKAWQRKFFQQNANLIKWFDKTNEVGNFQAQHYYLSRYINVTEKLRGKLLLAASRNPIFETIMPESFKAFTQLVSDFSETPGSEKTVLPHKVSPDKKENGIFTRETSNGMALDETVSEEKPVSKTETKAPVDDFELALADVANTPLRNKSMSIQPANNSADRMVSQLTVSDVQKPVGQNINDVLGEIEAITPAKQINYHLADSSEHMPLREIQGMSRIGSTTN